MTNRTKVSLMMTERTMEQVEVLGKMGFGGRTDIVRLAIERLFLAEAATWVSVTLNDVRPGHDPYHRGECVPTRTVLYVVPEERRAIVVQRYDSGATDADEYHRRTLVMELDLVDGTTVQVPNPNDLEAYLIGAGNRYLAEICAGYDVVWDGHNHVGQHTERSQAAWDALAAGIASLPMVTYELWTAEDFAGALRYEVTAETTDMELARLAVLEEQQVVDGDVMGTLREYRDELRGGIRD